jgi:CRP/FNR family transcriptional regulator, cyclic AMP receptor protein
MAFRQRGDYFGDMGLLDNRTDFATVIAMEPSKVLLISKQVFDEFFLDNKKALREVISILCHRLRESWAFNAIIGMGDAESKIRATLTRYGKILGVRDPYGVIINSTFTHQSIADHILVTRETVTRVLGRMKEQQEIEMVGRRIKLLPPFFKKNEQFDCNEIPVSD